MKVTMIVLMVMSATASADIARRTYTGVGGVHYTESESTPSCGKEARELMKKTILAAKTVTVTATTIAMNNGQAMNIDTSTEEMVSGMRAIDNPSPDFPDRKSALVLTVVRVPNGDLFLTVMRLVSGGGLTCGDTFSKSLD